MRVLDLFAGRLGWASVFAARGWKVTAFDLEWPGQEIPGVDYVRCDVLQLGSMPGRIGVLAQIYGFLESWPADFICASPPCEQFAVWGMRNFHKDPPFPHEGIRLFTHTQTICEKSGIPYIMENVRTAQQFVGKADNHCGSFYLWGNAVPALLPQGIKKGFRHKEMFAHDRTNRAKVSATIPPELANCVAEYAERLLEVAHAD